MIARLILFPLLVCSKKTKRIFVIFNCGGLKIWDFQYLSLQIEKSGKYFYIM